jgi:hypothetical protein
VCADGFAQQIKNVALQALHEPPALLPNSSKHLSLPTTTTHSLRVTPQDPTSMPAEKDNVDAQDQEENSVLGKRAHEADPEPPANGDDSGKAPERAKLGPLSSISSIERRSANRLTTTRLYREQIREMT